MLGYLILFLLLTPIERNVVSLDDGRTTFEFECDYVRDVNFLEGRKEWVINYGEPKKDDVESIFARLAFVDGRVIRLNDIRAPRCHQIAELGNDGLCLGYRGRDVKPLVLEWRDDDTIMQLCKSPIVGDKAMGQFRTHQHLPALPHYYFEWDRGGYCYWRFDTATRTFDESKGSLIAANNSELIKPREELKGFNQAFFIPGADVCPSSKHVLYAMGTGLRPTFFSLREDLKSQQGFVAEEIGGDHFERVPLPVFERGYTYGCAGLTPNQRFAISVGAEQIHDPNKVYKGRVRYHVIIWDVTSGDAIKYEMFDWDEFWSPLPNAICLSDDTIAVILGRTVIFYDDVGKGDWRYRPFKKRASRIIEYNAGVGIIEGHIWVATLSHFSTPSRVILDLIPLPTKAEEAD